jgi:hypothetical protein
MDRDDDPHKLELEIERATRQTAGADQTTYEGLKGLRRGTEAKVETAAGREAR